MSRQRRIRDETDGASVYFNIDKSGASDALSTSGAGVFDTMRSIAANVATKLTGKAAKRIAEKAVEKGAEKVGEKTGQLLGEKIYDRFNSKREQGGRENRGDLIIKKLKKPESQRPSVHRPIEKSISQQFDDLLNLF